MAQLLFATTFALLLCSTSAMAEVVGDTAIYDPSVKPKGLRNSTEGLYEVAPPSGFHMQFQHGPNSTFAVFRTEEGKGRDLAVRVNRHSEETGFVLKGSVLFRAGYNDEFTHILRAGDSIVVPECAPHGGIFGWDNNEETILIATLTEKYVEYGPDEAGGAPEEFARKVKYDPDSGVAESERCQNMTGEPELEWDMDDLRKWGEEHANDPVSTQPGWLN
ncbi:MAG: hypothetical protein J4A00_06385 [Gammaproteobacteria bacterium]|nr:hypothetical protein [Gammaproteobacteria bacterium]